MTKAEQFPYGPYRRRTQNGGRRTQNAPSPPLVTLEPPHSYIHVPYMFGSMASHA